MAYRLKWMVGGLLVLALCGCRLTNEKPETSPEPGSKPPDPVQAYLDKWQQKDFAGMYEMLTPRNKESMTEEQFVERYTNIYEGIEAVRLTVSEIAGGPQTEPDGDQATNGEETERIFEYRVSMDTIAGPLEFRHRGKLAKTVEEEGERWRVDWNPSLIFPSMQEGDKVRVQTIAGERGEIVDRNGVGLAVNGTAPQLGLVPGQLGESPDAVKAELAKKLGIEVKEIEAKLNASWVKPDLFVPIAVVSEGDLADYRELPGVAFQDKALRAYPLGEAAAHLTGYIGPVSAEDLERKKDKGYSGTDLIGKAGLEQVLEDRLRARNGVRIAIADASGVRKEIIAETEAVAGETVRLTIDAGLQERIYQEVKADQSSVAAIRPETGEIAALLGSPAYDPNAFVRGISGERYEAWNSDPRLPFLNRFSKGYSPGSSFKVVTAAIGLDIGTLDPGKAEPISGLTWAKDASWGNYYVKRVNAVDQVDLTKALVYSDNIYFAQAALSIGRESFAAEAARKFGIGEALPIEYPLAKSQVASGEIGSDIMLADTGYGQGQVTMTTLHVALAFSAIANGGDIPYPQLVFDPRSQPSRIWKEQAMEPETAAILEKALVEAVRKPGGVGHGAYIPGSSIAGKTGTAELKASKSEEGKENGWFVGYDADDPELLIAVMIEDVKGRGGSGYVAPIVKRIFLQAAKG